MEEIYVCVRKRVIFQRALQHSPLELLNVCMVHLLYPGSGEVSHKVVFISVFICSLGNIYPAVVTSHLIAGFVSFTGWDSLNES